MRAPREGSALTHRESEIIGLFRTHTWEQVQRELQLSETAIASYRARILKKLGLEDLTQLRLWASPVSNQALQVFTATRGVA